MKTFNSLEEMQPYYNEKTNTYDFFDFQKMIDVKFNFNLNTDRDINANDINARDINARNINARNINAWDITTHDIEACDIQACDIKVRDINACNINAKNIQANNINATNIEFYAVCFSYETFVCDSIKGTHKNSKYFCLDNDVIINKKED